MEENTTPESSVRPVLLGTAGHIDHGKTRLVSTLSGINTDRLPEERRRGISIDLGFAHFDHEGCRFGIIDVPGHERFVRQMVAGATCLDVALLVVAADDGVMPQTVEHFEILRLLGIPAGVVAITKCDLVDADLPLLVAEEIRDLVRGSFLDGSPVISVSSETGSGLSELRSALVAAVRRRPPVSTGLRFRLPVDRVFTLPGRGTIVTGSILDGVVQPGDEVELLPSKRRLRVRSVQHHGVQVEHAGSHRRAAINLPGVNVDELHRGDELATPGALEPAHRLLVELNCLRSCAAGLQHRALVALHLGTGVTPARLRLPGGPIARGSSGYGELRTQRPVVAQWGQRFIIRTSSGVTVGGGRIIDPVSPPGRLRDFAARCSGAAAPSPAERLSSMLAIQPSVDGIEAAQRAGIGQDEFSELLADPVVRESVVTDPGTGRVVHRRWLDRLARGVLRVTQEEMARRQPARMLPESVVQALCRGFRGSEYVGLAIQELVDRGTLVRRDQRIGLADMQVVLTKRQRQSLDAIVRAVSAGGRTPPTHKELLAIAGISDPKELESLISVAREDEVLVGVAPDLTYSPDSLKEIQRDLQALFKEHAGVTLAQIRDALSMTRKHVVPLAEYFDARGVTIRDNDLRRPGNQDCT